MKTSFKNSLMFMMITLALIISALGVTPAFADDETPPPATEEPAQSPTEAPVVAPEPLATTAPAAAEEPVAETTSVAEVLEQLPTETVLVVLDENNQAVPLATEAAAEAVAASDPYFTVGSTTYGFTSGLACPANVDICSTGLSTPIQAAVNYLASLNATPDDNTIYVEAGTYNENVLINGASWTTSLGALIVSGAGSSSTTVNGYFGTTNLINPFTLQGITFTNYVSLQSAGDVNVNDVIVQNSTDDGMRIVAGGNVSITNSTFQNNPQMGLFVDSTGTGNIALDHVTATGNADNGAYLRNGTGEISISNSNFDSNTSSGTDVGLDIHTNQGIVRLNGVSASNNRAGDGADIWYFSNLFVQNSTFNNNFSTQSAYGWGLWVDGYGDIELTNVTADGNNKDGALLMALGNASVTCSEFTGNGGYGIEAGSLQGSLSLASVNGNYLYYGNPSISTVQCTTVTPTVTVTPPTETATPPTETATPPTETATPPTETATPPTQTVTPPTETPAPPMDRTRFVSQQDPSEENAPLYFIVSQTQDQLPNAVGEGKAFGSAFRVVLTENGKRASNLEIMLSFPLTESMKKATLTVMFWNGSQWVKMSGGSVIGDYFVITVAHPGTYVLVSE